MLTNKILPEFYHKLKPFDHQEEVLAKSWRSAYYALFMEMGTGKSKVIIDTFSKLFLSKEIDGVLIVAPKGSYMNWIDEEIPIHMHDWIPRRIAHYDADSGKRERLLSYALLGAIDDCLDIMLVNVESLSTEKAFEFCETFVRSHHCMIVVDESTSIKSHSAKRTKALYKLRDLSEYRRILTGSPITDSPLDLYGQCEFLEKCSLGFTNWVSFQNHYAVVRNIVQGTRRYEQIVDYKNLPELSDKIQRFSYRKLKSECLDLPEKIWLNHYFEQSKEQKEAYEKMKEEAIIQFSAEQMVSSTSVITTMTKLHQINCGHIKDDFGNVHAIPHNRCKELIEILKMTKDKVIIWCHFKEDVLNITKAIKEEFGYNNDVVQYYGETSTDDRREAIERFRYKEAKYFVSTVSTGGLGLTLVESCFTVYYSYNYNLLHWLQSQDRNHRQGQKKNVTYVVMQIPRTVDVKIIKALKEKEDLANQVLSPQRAIELIS